MGGKRGWIDPSNTPRISVEFEKEDGGWGEVELILDTGTQFDCYLSESVAIGLKREGGGPCTVRGIANALPTELYRMKAKWLPSNREVDVAAHVSPEVDPSAILGMGVLNRDAMKTVIVFQGKAPGPFLTVSFA